MGALNFNIKICRFPFWCPSCGKLVRVGENYIDDHGLELCINELPGRNLVPLNKSTDDDRRSSR